MRSDKYFDELSLKPGHCCSTSCTLIRPPSWNEYALGGGCEGRKSGFALGWNPVMADTAGSTQTLPAFSLSGRTSREGEPTPGRTHKIKVNQTFSWVEILFQVPKKKKKQKYICKWNSVCNSGPIKCYFGSIKTFHYYEIKALWSKFSLWKLVDVFLCENNNNELNVGKNHFQIKTEKIPFQKCSHRPLQP